MDTVEVKVDELTKKQRDILVWLSDWERIAGPTEIGQKVGGKPYATASSWALPALKKLVALGYVSRTPGGLYSIKPTVRVPAELVG